jgi:uncharacterized Zn finger protein (UPF0148 family)
MNYCPTCGASLLGGTVNFCSDCGDNLSLDTKTPKQSREVPHTESERNPSEITVKSKRKTKQFKQRPVKKSAKKPQNSKSNLPTEPIESSGDKTLEQNDDGYDGYYDDIKPLDDGCIRDRSDPELVKRIVMIAAGAFAIVILSVVMMYLL